MDGAERVLRAFHGSDRVDVAARQHLCEFLTALQQREYRFGCK